MGRQQEQLVTVSMYDIEGNIDTVMKAIEREFAWAKNKIKELDAKEGLNRDNVQMRVVTREYNGEPTLAMVCDRDQTPYELQMDQLLADQQKQHRQRLYEDLKREFDQI